MKNRLKKAFTLVELVVVASLLGVIMTAVVMVLRPAQKHYTDINNRSQEQDNITTVTDLINAELRYAIGINVIYADKSGTSRLADGTTANVWSLVDADKYKNYIKMSNNYRETIGEFKARGYAEKGRTASHTVQETILNRAIFKDFDYQFSVIGFNTTEKQQSMTVAVDATPMIVTANNVEVDEGPRTHHFEDTFKFMNLRNKSKLDSDKILGLSPAATELSVYVDDSDADVENNEYGDIYIFYELPADIDWDANAEDDTENFGGPLGDGGAYDPLVPNLYVNNEGEGGSKKIVFLAMPAPGYSGSFKVKPQGTDTYFTYGENDYPNEQNLGFNGASRFEIKVTFGEGGRFDIKETDRSDRACPSVQESDFGTSNVIYVFDPGSSSSPNPQISTTDPTAAPDDAYNITVHYMYSVTEPHPGLAFTSPTSDPNTVRIDEELVVPGFIGCTSNRDFKVCLYTADSHVQLNAGYNETSTNWMDYPNEVLVLDTSVPNEIWVYNGEIYHSEPEANEGTIVVHYVTDFNDTVGGYYAQSDRENVISCSEGGILPGFNSGNFQAHFRDPHESFELTYTGVDGADLTFASGGLRNYFASLLVRKGVRQEIWLYNEEMYTEPPVVPQWEHEMTLHYLGAPPTSAEIGLKLIDVDSVDGSSLCDGSGVPNRNSTNIGYVPQEQGHVINRGGNGVDDQHTIKFLTPDAQLCICSLEQYGGHSCVTVYYDRDNPNLFKDIWIYNGSYFATEAEARAQIQAEGTPSASYTMGSAWEDNGRMIGQPSFAVTALDGAISHARIRVMFSRNVASVNLWDGSVGYEIDSGDTRVVYFDVYNLAQNATKTFSGQIAVTSVGGEPLEFSIVEISAETV